MKNIFNFIILFVMMTLISVFALFIAEMTDVMQLKSQKLSVTFAEEGDDVLMSWSPLPYPCTYKIETVSKTTGAIPDSPPYHHFLTETSDKANYILPRASIPTYYLISASGFFGEIFKNEKPIANPNFPEPAYPILIYHYPEDKPASLMPFLVWHTVPNAVAYEVEFLDAPPEIEGGISRSKLHHLESTDKVFTNGYQADLKKYKNKKFVYYRVRALGLHKEPIGEFCRAEKIYLDETVEEPNCPLINNFDFMYFAPLPIYPVYDWIPMHGADKYEVELLDHPPEVENDVEPSKDSLWRQTTKDAASCYDEYGRPWAGAYYWRVRALDKNNKPIGTWSNSEKFVVPDHSNGVNTAIFGDSISHGGGALSYSPRALEYSYATYIDFPVVNLSRSGDTSHTTVERFKDDVLPFKPKNLIISTGANSLRDPRISADDITGDLLAINKLCLQNDIRPIFLTLMPINPANIQYAFRTPSDPKWKDKMKKVNEFIKRQPYYIDIEPYFYDSAGLMSSQLSVDGLHPGLYGKMLIGELINKNKNLFR